MARRRRPQARGPGGRFQKRPPATSADKPKTSRTRRRKPTVQVRRRVRGRVVLVP